MQSSFKKVLTETLDGQLRTPLNGYLNNVPFSHYNSESQIEIIAIDRYRSISFTALKRGVHQNNYDCIGHTLVGAGA